MNHPYPYSWELSPKQAIALQKELAANIITHDCFPTPATVAGVDVGFENNGTIARAAVAILSFPELNLLDYAIARRPATFPYIPGLLSFREIPVILDALKQIQRLPELILVDGQGLAHPRRLGIACHLGLCTDIATIGVAKTRLVGIHVPCPEQRGTWTKLIDKGEIIGAVLRSRAGTKPLYISIGHKISLATAIHYVMACTTRFRLPETTRWAHRLASGTTVPPQIKHNRRGDS
ncbi:MAG: deoxyribonuclease V [Gammaproteobacteria bacterium]|nr:deoxyribonuclease V [Gammaproteobacteria bacterium]